MIFPNYHQLFLRRFGDMLCYFLLKFVSSVKLLSINRRIILIIIKLFLKSWLIVPSLLLFTFYYFVQFHINVVLSIFVAISLILVTLHSLEILLMHLYFTIIIFYYYYYIKCISTKLKNIHFFNWILVL